MKKKNRPINAAAVFFLCAALCLAAFWAIHITNGIVNVVLASRNGMGLDSSALLSFKSKLEPFALTACRWFTPAGLLLVWAACRFAFRKGKNKEIKALNRIGVILALTSAAMWIIEFLLGVLLKAELIMFHTICYGLPVAALMLGIAFAMHDAGEALFNRHLKSVGIGYFWAMVVSTVIGIILSILTTRVTTDAGTIMSVESYVPIDWLICVPVCIAGLLDGRRASLRKTR